MNQDFKECLESRKIIAFPRGNYLVKKELSIAQNDLSDANASFENQRYKWSTIQAYYAMFHAARALIYSRGYREKSHYCLSIALRALFVDEGYIKSKKRTNAYIIVQALLNDMVDRSKFQKTKPGEYRLIGAQTPLPGVS